MEASDLRPSEASRGKMYKRWPELDKNLTELSGRFKLRQKVKDPGLGLKV